MKNLRAKIEEKTKQLETLATEIAQLQQILRDKQIEALRKDGEITALKELLNSEFEDSDGGGGKNKENGK